MFSALQTVWYRMTLSCSPFKTLYCKTSYSRKIWITLYTSYPKFISTKYCGTSTADKQLAYGGTSAVNDSTRSCRRWNRFPSHLTSAVILMMTVGGPQRDWPDYCYGLYRLWKQPREMVMLILIPLSTGWVDTLVQSALLWKIRIGTIKA